MVMGDVLCECATEMAVADRDDPIEAFGLNRSYEAFGMRVGIGRASGRLHDVNARVAEPLADRAVWPHSPLQWRQAPASCLRWGARWPRGRLCRRALHEGRIGQLHTRSRSIDLIKREHSRHAPTRGCGSPCGIARRPTPPVSAPRARYDRSRTSDTWPPPGPRKRPPTLEHIRDLWTLHFVQGTCTAWSWWSVHAPL
jgi:hypothetical protein